jgi:hypothetical protein
MDPSESVTALPRDRSRWPTAPTPQHVPYGMPLDAGALLGRMYNIWIGDAPRQVGIIALPYAVLVALGVVAVVVAVVARVAEMGDPSIGVIVAAGGVGLAACVVSFALFVAAQAGAMLALEEAARGERRHLSVFGAIAAGWPAFWNLLGTYCLTGLGALVLCAPGAILVSVGAAMEDQIAVAVAGGALLFVGVCACLYGVFRLAVMVPSAVIEELGPVQAMQRSIVLTRGKVGSVFVASLLFGAVMMGINFATMLVGMIPLLGALVQLGVSIVLGSLQSAFAFSLYAALKDTEE